MATFSGADVNVVRQTMRRRRERRRPGKDATTPVGTRRARLLDGVRAIGRQS